MLAKARKGISLYFFYCNGVLYHSMRTRYHVKGGTRIVYLVFFIKIIRKACKVGREVSRAVLKTEGTVFPNTDRPRPANNMFIFFCGKLLYKKYLC